MAFKICIIRHHIIIFLNQIDFSPGKSLEFMQTRIIHNLSKLIRYRSIIEKTASVIPNYYFAKFLIFFHRLRNTIHNLHNSTSNNYIFQTK